MDDKPHRRRDMLLFWTTIILGLGALTFIQGRSPTALELAVSGVVLVAVYLVGRYSAWSSSG